MSEEPKVKNCTVCNKRMWKSVIRSAKWFCSRCYKYHD